MVLPSSRKSSCMRRVIPKEDLILPLQEFDVIDVGRHVFVPVRTLEMVTSFSTPFEHVPYMLNDVRRWVPCRPVLFLKCRLHENIIQRPKLCRDIYYQVSGWIFQILHLAFWIYHSSFIISLTWTSSVRPSELLSVHYIIEPGI